MATAVYACFLLLVLSASWIGETRAHRFDTDFVMCDRPGCYYDLNPFCLSTGQLVMGSCELKGRLCTNGVRNSIRVLSLPYCGLSSDYVDVYETQDGEKR